MNCGLLYFLVRNGILESHKNLELILLKGQLYADVVLISVLKDESINNSIALSY